MNENNQYNNPNVTVQPGVTPTPMPALNPTNPTVTPMPAQGVNVSATPVVSPMPTPSQAPVNPAPAVSQSAPVQMQVVQPVNTPSPQPTQVQSPITPAPIDSQITPQVQAPAPYTQVQAPTITSSVETQITPQVQAQAPEVSPVVPGAFNTSEVTVVNTKKSKASNIILIIILILMVLFVFNIETVIEYYDLYMTTGSLTGKVAPTDNLANGYILIDDNTSFINIDQIRFYNFRKSSDTTITFNYESNAKYDDITTSKIYIELYNYDKEILYKELFDPKAPVERGTVRIYTLNLTNDVYTDARFALVKKYKEEEEKQTSTLTCLSDENNVKSTIKYNFKNNGLISYSVTKEGSLENEYKEVKDVLNATYQNNTLSYTVDLSSDLKEYKPLYNKDTTKIIIKNKEELKKWKCE